MGATSRSNPPAKLAIQDFILERVIGPLRSQNPVLFRHSQLTQSADAGFNDLSRLGLGLRHQHLL